MKLTRGAWDYFSKWVVKKNFSKKPFEIIVFRSLSAPVQISHIKIKIKMVALMLAMSHSTKSELGALHFEGHQQMLNLLHPKWSKRWYYMSSAWVEKYQLLLLNCRTMFKPKLGQCWSCLWWRPPWPCRHVGSAGREAGCQICRAKLSSLGTFDTLSLTPQQDPLSHKHRPGGNNLHLNLAPTIVKVYWILHFVFGTNIPPPSSSQTQSIFASSSSPQVHFPPT